MKKAKVIITVVISLLVLVLILQNTQAVETKILFMTVTMPRALLLLVTFIIGFVAGLIAMSFLTARPSKTQGKSY
jgi:putative membrane protein